MSLVSNYTCRVLNLLNFDKLLHLNRKNNRIGQLIELFIRRQNRQRLCLVNKRQKVKKQEHFTLNKFVLIQSFLGISFGGKSEPEVEKNSTRIMSGKKLDELVLHADQLFDENKYSDTIELLKSYEEQDTYEIQWRLARALYSLSKTDESKKKELVDEAFNYAKRALELNENHFAAHKWYAVLLDTKSGLEGTKQRVQSLENFQKHLQRALELNPQDATTWYILGEYYYGLADLNWMTRKVVQVVFANPPSATFEQALECYEKAENISPDFYSLNKLSLGKTFLQLNNKEKAKEFLTKASNVDVLNEDDKKCKEEALKLLKKC
uniref:Regulator of microtubule dynamics protein 1 n=1 Tax=Culicoides sonorensis TaxID=179676 RepID=A0A336MV80_CULSO